MAATDARGGGRFALIDMVAATLVRTIAAVVLLSTCAVLAGWLLKLTLAGAIGLYFVVWWIVLFAILPLRITSQAEAGEVTEGSDPGAPASPALRHRAIWTTITSSIIFVLVAYFFPLAGL